MISALRSGKNTTIPPIPPVPTPSLAVLNALQKVQGLQSRRLGVATILVVILMAIQPQAGRNPSLVFTSLPCSNTPSLDTATALSLARPLRILAENTEISQPQIQLASLNVRMEFWCMFQDTASRVSFLGLLVAIINLSRS
jgi:hypothetical protein